MHEISSRDQLLNNVRDFVALKVSERPELLAAFLVGSVARADPLWANTTDFDVIFVDPDPPVNLEPCLLWKDFKIRIEQIREIPCDGKLRQRDKSETTTKRRGTHEAKAQLAISGFQHPNIGT